MHTHTHTHTHQPQAQLAGSLALTKVLGAATERLGTSKYFFGVAAVVSAGIALYLHFTGK